MSDLSSKEDSPGARQAAAKISVVKHPDPGLAEAAGDARARIEAGIDQARTGAQRIAGTVKDSFQEQAEHAQTALRETVDRLQVTARQVADQAEDLAEDLYGRGSRAAEALGERVQTQPLLALALAGAIGYGLAFLLHRSGTPAARPARSRRRS